MRRLAAIAALPFLAAAAHAAEIKGASRIDQVTVFPSGAEVTRVARVRMERGEHVLLFNDLPARALAGSIRVEGKAAGRLDIASVDTRRALIPLADAAEMASSRKSLEDAIQGLKDQRAQLEGQAAAAEAQKAYIDALSKSPAQPAPAGAAATPQTDWERLFGFIGQRRVEAQKAVLEAQLKIRDLDRQIRDLEGKLASLAPRPEERTEVKVFVNAGASLEADLVIRYQVPAASWTPYYDARLATGTKTQAPKLTLERRASIQQRSGEAWDNVQLALSTTRPGSSTSAPDLGTLTIDFEADAIPPPAPPAPRPMAAPLAAQRSAKLTAGAVADEESERAREQVVAPASEVRASIDVQGFQALYGIAGRVSVPATGEAKRVQIDETQADPALVVRTVPKREQKAFLYAKAQLAKGSPVLPGTVSLFRDGTFVGTGRLPLLPAGEEHELGFGADDSVRVKYALTEEKRGETGLISSSKTDLRTWRISVKNLHQRQIPVSVVDHIPVSQNQDIKVELTGKTPPSRREVDDKRGVLAWDYKLEPDEEKVIEFGYRASWPGAKRVQYRN
ncbi:MAG: mucoidy inhibitor MuiA family protein [Hyphomicrobiaceae bacterium]|nr:mucoidy inhibitor MuiA family protein [Hyphomicrobiaceae bacterium]